MFIFCSKVARLGKRRERRVQNEGDLVNMFAEEVGEEEGSEEEEEEEEVAESGSEEKGEGAKEDRGRAEEGCV